MNSKVALKHLCVENEWGKYGIPASAEGFDESKVRYLRITDISDTGELLDNDKKSVSSPDIEKYILEDGDIVFARTGNSTGRTYFHEKKNGKLAFAGFLIKYKLDYEKVNPKYLKYYTLSNEYKEWVKNLSVGSTRGNINAQTFANCPISLPPREQQNTLVDTLSLLDSKIELNNKINAELEAMAKSIYDYWFVQFEFPVCPPGGTTGGSFQRPGAPKGGYKSSGGKMVWNEELKREIPEGWEVKTLGDIIQIFDSKRIPLSKQQREQKKGSVPYYGATGVMDYIDEAIFEDEFVLVAEDGSVMDENGFLIVQFIWGKSWVNNHAHVIQGRKKSHNEYIYHLVKRIQAVQITTGSIQLKINQENLKSVNVVIPNSEVLDSFCSLADSIRRKMINCVEENQQLATLRDWLLPMLMNGQVKVGHPVSSSLPAGKAGSSNDRRSVSRVVSSSSSDDRRSVSRTEGKNEEKLGLVAEGKVKYGKRK